MYSILGTDHYYGTTAEMAAFTPRVAGSTFHVTDGLKLYYTWDGANWIQPLMGGATCWRDLDFPLIPKATGAGNPAYVTLQGNITALQWAVNDALQCDEQELPHDWQEGSTIYWHLHLITNGLEGSNKYVRFSVEHTFANSGSVLSAAATITSSDLLIPLNTTTKTHLMFQLGTLALGTQTIGAQMFTRLKRVAAVGAAPAANPWVGMLQAHIIVDTAGSKSATAK